MIYDFIQMAVMAGIFSYTYVYLRKHVYHRAFRILTLVFFAAFPVNAILAISTTKDVIFSGMALLCLVLFAQAIEAASKKERRASLALLFPACIIMLLFRNNAVYAFYLFLAGALLAAVFGKDKFFRKAFLYIACCLFTYKSVDMALTKVLDVSEGSVAEAFSVPSQQFGRIYGALEPYGTDQETLDLIRKYYDMDRAVYLPHLSDYMKGYLDLENNKLTDYIGDSIRLFCEYPAVSIDSFLYLTEGAWNIGDTSHAQIYGEGLDARQGYLLTDVKENYGISHKSKCAWLESFLEHAFSNNEYQAWPVISLLFSPALYVWILGICTIVLIKTKSRYYFFAVSFLWFLLLTILAGPCVLIRYYYPFVVCSPVLVCIAKISVCGSSRLAEDRNADALLDRCETG